MRFEVSRERRSLNKVLTTVVALERSGIPVFGHVLDVGSSLNEALRADLTDVRSDSGVDFQVRLEARFVHEAFAAHVAKKRLHAGVDALVIDQVVLLQEGLWTVPALVLFVRIV